MQTRRRRRPKAAPSSSESPNSDNRDDSRADFRLLHFLRPTDYPLPSVWHLSRRQDISPCATRTQAPIHPTDCAQSAPGGKASAKSDRILWDHYTPAMTPPTALERRPASTPLDEILSILDRDGGLVIEGMFTRDLIDAIRRAADQRADLIEPGSATQGLGEDGAAFVGTNTTRFSSLGKLTPAYFDMLDNELFASIADAVLLPTCGSYWVNTAQVMYIGPGEPAQVLHRDGNNWWEFVSRTWPDSPEVTISAMIGLSDVTEEVGATRVVPGSHRWSELQRFEDDVETVPAELGPGDALVYSGKVLHGGGANQTADRTRRAMHLSFVAGWLTPEESSAIDYTTEELAEQSPRVQRLLGHRSYDPRPHRGGGLWLKQVKAIEEN